MPELLGKIANAIAADLATWLVYIAIAFLFVICLMRCVLPVAENRGILRRAARQVKKDGKNGSAAWQSETFLGKGALFAHWSEYLNNLFFADGAYHNPSNLEDYINEDTAIYGPGRSALSDAAPGLMVSLGFLGTLLGISNGLRGFSMDNITEVTGAIQRLIPNMQYAFNTSIAGVVASVLFTLINKNAQGGARSALLSFYSCMNKYAGVASVDPMTQIAIYQQEQTKLLSELSKNMTGELADSVADAVEEAMQPLQRSMDSFMQSATREQLRGVDAIVQRFLDHMDDALGGQFAALSATMTTASRSQRDLQQTLAESVTAIRAMARDLTEAQRASDAMFSKFSKYLETMENTQKAAEESAHTMASGGEQLALALQQQSVCLQNAAKLQEETDALIRSLREAATLLDNALRESDASLAETAKAVESASSLLAQNSEKLLDGVARDIDQTYNRFFGRLNETMDDIRRTVEGLPQVLADTSEMYAREAETLTSVLRGMRE